MSSNFENFAPIPAEWASHTCLYTAWPSAADLWLENLAPARAEVGAMVAALAQDVDGQQGDRMVVFAANQESFDHASAALMDVAEVVMAPFGDIWLRDTGPIFGFDGAGSLVAHRFGFNGWGGKYQLDFDDEIGAHVTTHASGTPIIHAPIMEGGALEHDGLGTIITTRQCLLNPNRNAHWDEAHAELALKNALGAKKILWLGDGLANDHTDGHVDNIARFVGPNHVVCQSSFGADDPNAAVLAEIYADLCAFSDANGTPLKVSQIPSPGLITNEEGDIVPASHMNFIIGNASVVMPHYGAASTDEALRQLADIFPTKRVVAVGSIAILSGGGSFHCITQQVPAFEAKGE